MSRVTFLLSKQTTEGWFPSQPRPQQAKDLTFPPTNLFIHFISGLKPPPSSPPSPTLTSPSPHYPFSFPSAISFSLWNYSSIWKGRANLEEPLQSLYACLLLIPGIFLGFCSLLPISRPLVLALNFMYFRMPWHAALNFINWEEEPVSSSRSKVCGDG